MQCYRCPVFTRGGKAIVANLIVRNVDDAIANALKVRASRHGISAEAEHRLILEEVLLKPKKRSLIDVLREIPPVGRDEDFERRQSDNGRTAAFFLINGVRNVSFPQRDHRGRAAPRRGVDPPPR
jgi:antitoxin FitA